MSLPEITWAYILNTRRENGGTSAVSIESAEQALLHLRSILGEDVAGLPERVMRTLLDWSPWTYLWLSWLSSAVVRVERADGFASLRARLASPAKFEEAYSVLQVADRLDAAALRVRFDVPVQVGPSLKVPDILVMDSEIGANFYCEVSMMFSANAQVSPSRFLDTMHAVIIQTAIPIAFAGRLLRSIDDKEIGGLINRIQWELFEVEKDSSFHEIDLGDALQLALAPIAHKNLVSVWARERGLQLNSLSGAALPAVDHCARLRRKIEEEARQLPVDRPNLVVIAAQDLLMDTDHPAHLAATVKEIVSDHPKVAALVLTSEGFGHVVPSARKIGEDLYAISDRDGLVHEHILVLNRFCPEMLPASLLAKLYKAFTY